MKVKLTPKTQYALILDNMQQISRRLQAFMIEKGLTQNELAEAANVSQSTVSRIMRRTSQRHGRALVHLCNYAGISLEDADTSTERRQRMIINTFMKVWDGTDSHAETIARVIEALQDVRLKPAKPDRSRRKP